MALSHVYIDIYDIKSIRIFLNISNLVYIFYLFGIFVRSEHITFTL